MPTWWPTFRLTFDLMAAAGPVRWLQRTKANPT
jgi:hypothetical protein